jgi:hypothetical protein
MMPYVLILLGMAAWFTLVLLNKADSQRFIEVLIAALPALGVGSGINAIHLARNAAQATPTSVVVQGDASASGSAPPAPSAPKKAAPKAAPATKVVSADA